MSIHLITEGTKPWSLTQGGLSVYKERLYNFVYFSYDKYYMRDLFNNNQASFRHKVVECEKI